MRRSKADVEVAKRELRLRMRWIRASQGVAERGRRAAAAGSLLLGLPELEGTPSVLLFYSFGTEMATAGLLPRLRETGARVLLPRVTEGEIEAVEAVGELAGARGGPREPTGPAVPPAEVDVIVVPGLAFDSQGRRLGYGGGHYDRFLPHLRDEAVRIGLAFATQLVELVPTGPGDQDVQIVVTDAGVIDCRSPRESHER